MVYVQKIQLAGDFADGVGLVGKQKALGALDAVTLTELYGTLAAVFLEQSSEIAAADAAAPGNLLNVYFAVLL